MWRIAVLFVLSIATVSAHTRFLFGVQVECNLDATFQFTVSHREDDENVLCLINCVDDDHITKTETFTARRSLFIYQDGGLNGDGVFHLGGEYEPYALFVHNCSSDGRMLEFRHNLPDTSTNHGLMSEFHKVTRRTIGKKEKKIERSFSWISHLHDFERGKAAFVPADAFVTSLLVNFNEALKEGVVFETTIRDYEKSCEGVEVRWFAKVEKLCGYRALVQYIGSESKFWINYLSDSVYSLASAATLDPLGHTFVYAPPLALNREYQKDIVNFVNNSIEGEMFGQMALSSMYDQKKMDLHKPRVRIGQRLELLNYTNSTEIRVARVQATCGRRINVLVTKKDFPGSLPAAEDDRQVQNVDAQYWIDEASFFIFPVGFAAINGYKLNAKKDYIEHTKKIAECIKNGKTPSYDIEDVTFEQLPKNRVNQRLWSQLKVGQKFELIDPLAQQFNSLHVASILKFCKTDGYLIVGMDGPDALEDSFPIHIDNCFMFPVGYSEMYGLTLQNPDGYEGEFTWNSYLKEQDAEPLPLHLFKPMPDEERLSKFRVGMHLEAADMCENQFICPATIKSMHGRLINVNFDGWDEEFDELYDIDSHDILPIGWCELHDYVLQMPKR